MPPSSTLQDTGLDAVDVAMGVAAGHAHATNSAATVAEFEQRIRDYGHALAPLGADILLRLVMRQGLVLDALGWPDQATADEVLPEVSVTITDPFTTPVGEIHRGACSVCGYESILTWKGTPGSHFEQRVKGFDADGQPKKHAGTKRCPGWNKAADPLPEATS